VSDADVADDARRRDGLTQRGHLSFAFVDFDAVPIPESESGGVVATILQILETGQEVVGGLLAADTGGDSTHCHRSLSLGGVVVVCSPGVDSL
jgi:hypothetical protein